MHKNLLDLVPIFKSFLASVLRDMVWLIHLQKLKRVKNCKNRN